MASVRQRQPPSLGNNQKKKLQDKGGGLLLTQEDDGLEIKYVVIILIIVFIFSFVAALYCLGMLGDNNILLSGRDSSAAPPPPPSQFFPGEGGDEQQLYPEQGEVPQEWEEQRDMPHERYVDKEDVQQEWVEQAGVPQKYPELEVPQEWPEQGQNILPEQGQNIPPMQGEHTPPMQGQNMPMDFYEDEMMPPPRPIVPTGPPKEEIPKPKSDSIARSLDSDHEPPVRQKTYIPPAPKDTKLDKPTILWWTEALYPHGNQGLRINIDCGTSTCVSTAHKNLLGDPMTRGIMFYGTDVRSYEMPLPRKSWHEWALLHEESPQNNYLLAQAPMLRLFNHTATFHRSSHYPLTTQNVPSLEYLVERKPVPIEIKNEFRKKGVAPIAYVQSHCNVPSDRDRYVKKLMEYIPIDSFGKCAHNKDLPPDLRDPVQSMSDEKFYNLLSNYKFNLAFENAICDDYITEKFYRPLYVGSVPISRGSGSAKHWAPDDNSIILSEDFNGPEELAKHIKFLDENDEEYLKYLNFKDTGVTNKNLIKAVAERKFGVSESGGVTFISDFECYLCEKITERWEAEKAHKEDPSKPLLPPRLGEYGHLPCAEPFAAIYPLDEAGDTTDIQAWKDDYWFNFDQAMALKYMIEKGYKNSDKVFDVVDKLRRKQNRHH